MTHPARVRSQGRTPAELSTRPWARALASTLASTLSVASVVAAVSLQPAVASADPSDPEAKSNFQRGVAAFDRGDYDAAIAAFEAGYAIEDDPLFLYSMAQAEKNNDNCPKAVKLFKQFIATDVPEGAKKAARDGILACADLMAEAGSAAEPTNEPLEDPIDDTDPETEPEPAVQPQPKPRDRAHTWYLDPIGDSLAAVGVVGVGVGAGLLIGAGVLAEQPQAPNYAQHDARLERVDDLRLAGAITAGVGGALLIGGVVRWVVVARKRDRATVGLMWRRGVAGLQVQGRF